MSARLHSIARLSWSYKRGYSLSCQKLHIGLVALLICLFLLGLQDCSAKKGEGFQESQVKSVFLYNLTKFITWPGEQQSLPKRKFQIGILGIHNFNSTLEKVVENEKVGDREIQLVFWDSLDHVNWSTLDMLFVGKDFLQDFELIRNTCRAKKILTVGDSEGFCQQGGMVNLLTENRRMKLEINIDEIAPSGFMVSGNVLKLATIVRTRTQKK